MKLRRTPPPNEGPRALTSRAIAPMSTVGGPIVLCASGGASLAMTGASGGGCRGGAEAAAAFPTCTFDPAGSSPSCTLVKLSLSREEPGVMTLLNRCARHENRGEDAEAAKGEGSPVCGREKKVGGRGCGTELGTLCGMKWRYK